MPLGSTPHSFWGQKDSWLGTWIPIKQELLTAHLQLLPWLPRWLRVKNLPPNSGEEDVHSIPSLGRSPGGGMATHSSILLWEISWTEEPGGLQSMESQRVRHNVVTKQCSLLFSQTKLNNLFLR